MFKNLISVMCFTLFVVNTFAQSQSNTNLKEIVVSGKVIDAENNEPLEYATVSFFSISENKVVTGGITDTKGEFKISVPTGTYNISVEYISYKTITFNNRTLTSNINLGTINLELDVEALGEVEVIAEKSTVEIRLDKKIYNVGRDMTVKGGTASDVLDNVPSVTVDIEGNVALRGNENVRILINGKPSGLVGLSGTDALRQLPADAIEKVEVITSPSARYDAEGTAGILNIILRKGKALGLNGTINLDSGIPTRYGVSANLNLRAKKFNHFINTGYSYNDSPGNAFFDTEYFQNDDNERFKIETRNYDRERENVFVRAGTEYFLSDKSSITGNVLWRRSDRFTDTSTETDVLDINEIETFFLTRSELEDELDNQIEFNLNFTQTFNSDDHKLTFDFRHEDSSEEEIATILSDTLRPFQVSELTEITTSIEDQRRILIQSDYVLPIGENAQFEAGFRSNINDLETDYTLEREDENNLGTFLVDEDVSNIFVFDERIHALYTQYGNKFGKLSALFGLRMEATNIDVKVIGQSLDANKKYTQLFPTLNLALELGEKESITLGYNRRIRRPRSWFINPFPSRASRNNVFKGNPDLNPAYSNGVDIGYLKQWGKLTFNTSIYYNYSTDVFQFVDFALSEYLIENPDEAPFYQNLDTENVTLRTPINIASEDRFGWEFSFNYNPYKWWRLNSNFNFFRTTRNGKGIIPDFENESWFARLNSRITVFKTDWQTTFMYRGPQEDFQSKRRGQLGINMALSKDIFKEKATLSFSVNDLLNQRRRIAETFIEGFSNSYNEFQWRERQFRLNFTYRINQQKNNRRNRQRNQNNGGGFDGGEEGGY